MNENIVTNASSPKTMVMRSKEKTFRVLNSKLRTIGIDKEYLDHQVKEKKKILFEEKRKQLEEAKYQEELTQQLEKAKLIENELKLKKKLECKRTILEQMKLQRNDALSNGGPLDLDNCGSASLQVFSGEDSELQERIKRQKQQILNWCANQIERKQDSIMKEREADKRYSEYVLAEDALRCAAEKDKMKHDKEKAKTVQTDNLKAAKKKQTNRLYMQEMIDKIEKNEIMNAQNSHLLSENVRFGDDCKIRSDHFKGFSSKKIAQIFAENHNMVTEKHLALIEKKRMEQEWIKYQCEVVKKLEDDEIRKLNIVQEQNYLQAKYLRQQYQELEEKRLRMKREQCGGMEGNFFQGFGTSFR